MSRLLEVAEGINLRGPEISTNPYRTGREYQQPRFYEDCDCSSGSDCSECGGGDCSDCDCTSQNCDDC